MSDSCSVDCRQKVEQFIADHNLAPYITFAKKALLWENFIYYGIIVAVVLLDLTVGAKTELTNLSYFCLFALQTYLVKMALNQLKFIEFVQEEQDLSVKTVLDKMCCIRNKCCSGQCPKIEELKKNELFMPLATTGILLFLTLFFNMFSGRFLSIVVLLFILLAPGIHSKGFDVKAKDLFMEKAWPKIKPIYEQNVKPQLDKLMNKSGGAASSGAAAAAPAPAPAAEAAPAAEPAPAAEAATDAAAAEGAAEGDLSVDKTE